MGHRGANRRIGGLGAKGRPQPYIPSANEQIGIISRDYWNILAKQSLSTDPILMVRGLHILSEGLLDHSKPTRADGEFASNAFHYFSDLAHNDTQTKPSRKTYVQPRSKTEQARRGWSLVIAEDALCMVGLVDCLNDPHAKQRLHKSQYRNEAQSLLAGADDKVGMYVNATQGILYDRIRGVVPSLKSIFTLSGAVILADSQASQASPPYASIGFSELTSKQAAQHAFLKNVYAHQSV